MTAPTNRQIGEPFEGLSYSAVAKASRRFSAEVKKEKPLRKVVEKITDSLSYVKGRGPRFSPTALPEGA